MFVATGRWRYFDGRFEENGGVDALEEHLEELALGEGRRLPGGVAGAQAEEGAAALASAFVQHRQRHEERHLEDEQDHDAHHGTHAERTQRRHRLIYANQLDQFITSFTPVSLLFSLTLTSS